MSNSTIGGTKGRKLRKSINGLSQWLVVCVVVQSLALRPTYADSCGGGGGGDNTGVIIEYQFSGASGQKCGFGERLHDDDPRVHIFHTEKVREVFGLDYSSTVNQTTTNIVTSECGGGGQSTKTDTSEPGTVSKVDNLDYDVTCHFEAPGPECIPSTNYFTDSTYHEYHMLSDGRRVTTTGCSGGEGCQGSCFDYSYGLDDISASPAIVNGNWVWSGTKHHADQNSSCGPCIPSSTNDTTTNWTGVIHCGGYDGTVPELSRMHKKVLAYIAPNEPNPPQQAYWTDDVEEEYTDQELRDYIMGKMPAYTGWFPAGAGQVYAYSLISGSHVDAGNGADCWFSLARLGKMKFRFSAPDAEAGAQYRVTYDVITWDTTTGQVDVNSGSCGIGDETEVMPPYWDNSREYCGGLVVTFVANVAVSKIPPANGQLPGSGPLLSADSGCATCGGRSNNRFNGFQAGFTMGQSALDRTAPYFQIVSSVATTNLATPAGLYYPTNADLNVEVIQVANQIRQVKGPQALADVVTLDGFSYEIRYYLPSQVGSKVSGVYTVSGSPYVTWKIQNPDASTTTFNRIRITETRGTDVRTYESTNTVGTSNWQVGYPGNLVENDRTTSIDTNGMSATIIFDNGYHGVPGYKRTVTTTTKIPGGSDQMKVKRVYQTFNWGEGLIEETLNPDSNPKTTIYTYYEGYWFFNHGQPVQKVIHPDGSWEWYQYDSYERVSSVYSSSGDVAPSGSTPPSNARHTDYLYVLSGSPDDATLHTNVARVAITYEGSLGYTIFPAADTRIDIQTTRNPSAGWPDWDDPSNLFTTNRYYTNGANLNRLKSVVHPDGTLTTYDYADDATGNYRTNMTATGQPNGAFTAVVDGTTNWSVVNLSGQPVVSVTKDIASGIVVVQETFSNYDDFGRPGRVTHLDGTYEDTYYSCCGLDSRIDRDGVTTTYLYDAARRQVAQTRQGITTTNILDSVGHTLKTIRIGTDASQVVKGQWQYDLGGQLIKQTNALNGVTSYTETTNSVGARVTITTYPDNGTRYVTNYLDGRVKQIGGTAANPVRYEYGTETASTGDLDDYGRRYMLEIKLNADGSDSLEWTKGYIDNLGRNYKTIYADSAGSLSADPYTKSWYNNKGQLWKERDPDGVIMLYSNNVKGQLEYTVVDMNQNDTIDFSGTDRITRTTNDVVYNSALGANVRRTRTYAWSTDNANTSMLLSTTDTSTDGLHTWQTTYRDASISVTNRLDTVNAASGYRYLTNTAPDRSYTVNVTRYGTNVSSTRYDANNNQLQSTSYLYDSHLRANRITDARNGTTTNWFNNQDQISGIKTPVPAAGLSALVSSNFFDNMGRIFATKLPDGTFVTNKFDLRGMVTNTFGSRTYPVAYTYDTQGRQKTMTTWQNYAGNQGAATTTWNYDIYRGWTTNKSYADGHGPNYTYTAAGRLNTRVWVRGITTSYAYNNAGDLSSVSYSDGTTPGVSYTFDRRGRQKTIAQNGITTAFAYNDASQVLSESYSGGTLDGLSATNGYDQFMRRTNLAALYSSTPLLTNSYSYDAASRLQTVRDGGTNSATYTYVVNSPLVSQILFTNGGVQRMVTTKSYDLLNRLTNIVSATNGTAVASFAYQYNSANQRTRRTDVDGSYWVYTYDSLGQITSGKKFWIDNTPVAGQQFTYSFDDIGNRKTTGAGGDQTGGPLRNANYGANNLNQYGSRDVPGYVNVIGGAKTNATVSLWTLDGWWAPTIRHADYYRGELAVNNSTGALWLTITNLAVLGNGGSADITTNTVGNLFLPKNQEVFGYDLDGNLTSDGRWNYTWDAENRLIRMVANTTVAPPQRLDFEYDSKSRRIRKKVWNNTAGTGTPATDLTLVYDGWNLMGDLNSSHAAVKSYLWGLDLSGSMDRAGGIGGLLEVTDAASGLYFAAFDGNGNMAALVNVGDTTLSAVYEFDPFGETIRSTGFISKSNPFRWSTRYLDEESGIVMYPFRPYRDGRFLTRDPLEEKGGLNLYHALQNNCVNRVDPLGRSAFITFAFGFDASVDVTGEVLNFIRVQVYGVNRMILKCFTHTDCGCSSDFPEIPTAVKCADFDHNKPDPEDKEYNDNDADTALAKQNWQRVKYAGVHTVITIDSIRPEKTWDNSSAYGWSPEGVGILLNGKTVPGGWYSPSVVLAHEFGHFLGYKGDDPENRYHSLDEHNLMFKSLSEQWDVAPDCQWCDLVRKFASGK